MLHAFEKRAPPGALANALAHVNATAFTNERARDTQRLMDIFLASAPGTSSTAFLYPGREATGLTEAQFRYCMNGLVAPPYPWEDLRQPPGGCPPTGYGPRSAELPAPPPGAATPLPPIETSPTPAVTSAPRPVPPTTATPTLPAPVEDAPVDGQPGAIQDPDNTIGSGGEIEIPGATLALVLAALVAVAILRRR